MPKKSLWSQQAKAQRASGKQGFDTGYTDNPFENLFDPDFEPDLSAGEEEVDSDCNASPCGYTFLMVDKMSGKDDMDVNETELLSSEDEEDFEKQLAIAALPEKQDDGHVRIYYISAIKDSHFSMV
jgi:hypothetical protein